ncbi:MAG: ABC transporter ATP-binding protein/permease [Pseudonocardiales bacterium]|nr:ABC transporter ATP-binding protein/permease [Pseudonocardiales bacterium]MBV9729685.1 ABC transporter ATP-binding protein/permease [Pseudonocardiales bacterium]
MSLDWKHEWIASLAWSGTAFVITVAAFTVVIWLLTRSTHWGRQFCRITIPYFQPDRSWVSWRPLLTLLVMLWMTVLAVRLDVLLSYWTNGLFTALQEMKAASFGYILAVFGVLTTIYFIHTMVGNLISQTFIIQWRSWLNDHMVGDWLDGRAYHRGQFVTAPVDNPDQRIQEDITAFVTESQALSMGAVRAVVSLMSFTPILWTLSGPLPLFGHTIPRAMVFLSYLYVIVASVAAFRIGRPLIRLNFLNEGLGASFRYALIRLRDHSENIAFYHGEEVEQTTLATRFAAIITNRWRIVFRGLKFDGFNIAVSQIALVIPYIIQAPRFFRHVITLGDVQQTTIAFGQVHGALSFFRNSYGGFAAYRATITRLTGLLDANSQTRALPSVAVADCPDGLDINNLTVCRPDGQLLIDGLNLHLSPGQALLITGASGSGKTTLLRSLADLWPYAQGTVRRPTAGRALFLSQQPYVPLGALRTALTYPQSRHPGDDEQLRNVLRMVQLGHLEGRIEEEADWSRILSAGEQQRLGFARILVNRPRLVFLDQATSAVDEGIEHALYTLVREDLPECTLVIVGHRSTLNPVYTHYLELLGEGRWDVTVPIGQPESQLDFERFSSLTRDHVLQ